MQYNYIDFAVQYSVGENYNENQPFYVFCDSSAIAAYSSMCSFAEGEAEVIYDLSGNAHMSSCPVCGVCPQPFGICLFILIIGILIVVALIIFIIKCMRKKCDRCGHSNWKTAIACKHCGHPLVKRRASTNVIPAYSPKVEPYAKREREKRLGDNAVYCIRCGVPLEKDAQVCFNCGTNQVTGKHTEQAHH